MNLTPRQAEILYWIARYNRQFRRGPSYREIGAAFDIRSTNGVKCLLTPLHRKGALAPLGRWQAARTTVAVVQCIPCAEVVAGQMRTNGKLLILDRAGKFLQEVAISEIPPLPEPK